MSKSLTHYSFPFPQFCFPRWWLPSKAHSLCVPTTHQAEPSLHPPKSKSSKKELLLSSLCLPPIRELSQRSHWPGWIHWSEVWPDPHKPCGQRMRKCNPLRKIGLLLLDGGEWSWKCKERLYPPFYLSAVHPYIHPPTHPHTYISSHPPTHIVTQITS